MFAKKWLFILLMPCWCVLQAQPNLPQITGIVQADDGTRLAGVSITLTGPAKTYHTQTNINGEFNFSDAAYGGPYSLFCSYTGYEFQRLDGYKIIPGSLITLSVRLRSSSKLLSPVVIVGYGKAFKKDVSSSVTSLLPDELGRGVITSPALLLQGRVAGLNISKDGNPNGVPSVILRGPSTLNLAQQPFYVIDEVPDAAIELVSPDDIMSIEILKDASATAIYGNRAANGVIFITTRKGKAGEAKTTYTAYTSIQKIANYIPVASAMQLRDFLKDNNKVLAPADDNGGDTNWQQQVSRIGYAQNHNLGFNGGTEKLTYSGSLNYFKNQAIIKGSSLERFAGRFGLEQNALNGALKFKYSLYDMISNQSDVDSLVFYNVLRFLPTLNVYNPDGTFKEDLTRTQTYNPLALINNNQYDTKINTILANAGLEAKLPFNIVYNLNIGYQTRITDYNIYHNRYSLLAYSTNGQAIRSTYQDTKKVLETYFSYSDTLGTDHKIKLLLGYSWQQDDNGDGFQASNVNFPSDATSYFNLGLGQPPPGYIPQYGDVSLKTLRLISFYGRLNYNYRDRYLFQGTLRRDGSSAFGVNHRWGYFPSVSAAWRLIEENFIKRYNFLSDLKLRIGYGVAGNTIGFNPLIPLLLNGSTGSFYYNGTFIRSIGPVQNPNPNLQWEKTGQINVGLDLCLFKNRFTGTIDIYSKTTTGLIYNYQQPTSASYTPGSLIYANAGSLSNKGVEITLAATPLAPNNWWWNSSFNIAHNSNRVVSLSNNVYKIGYIFTGYPSGMGQSNVNTQIIQAGYPVGQFYTLRYLGKNSVGVSFFQGKDGRPTTAPRSTDQTYLGNAQPKLVFGWNNDFRFHHFELDVFVRGVTGNKILNATLATLNSPSDASNHNIPKLTLSGSYNDYNSSLYSDRYLENGAYLRLDNATLGYEFKNIGKYVHSLKLRVTGTDLFTITGYTGIDPEINIGTITPGIDNHNYYPKTRSFIMGLTLEL